MTIFHAIILGIVEGLTEFIPVSSTGHLILAAELLGIPQSEFLKTFEIFIQLGALLAIMGLFVQTLRNDSRKIIDIVFAFIPTAIIGLVLYKVVKNFLGSPTVVIWSLLIGGIVLILVEWWVLRREKKGIVPLGEPKGIKAFFVGVFQTLALIPGVSRSGATIVGGLLMGISRPVIVQFSFLLAIPTIAAAAGLDLIKSDIAWDGQTALLLAIGFISAFVSALLCTKFFLRYVSRHSFIVFGVYRIIIALILIIVYL